MKKKNFRKGFTLVELVAVIVVIGILFTGIWIKLGGFKDETSFQGGIDTDIQVLTRAVEKQRPAGGTHATTTTARVAKYMSNYEYDAAKGIVSKTVPGCYYKVAPSTNKDSTASTANLFYQVYMDCSEAITNSGINAKVVELMENAFIDSIKVNSRNGSALTGAFQATTIVNNTAFDSAGTVSDGKVGFYGIQ